MYPRLLNWLRCPACGGDLTTESADGGAADDGLVDGILRCTQGHAYPVHGGIPRMLPNLGVTDVGSWELDHRTQESFSRQWEFHDQGDRTWGLQLDDRLQRYVVEPLRLSAAQLEGAVLLDAGCGNGSLSVAISEAGPEVIGLDLSSGLELGHAFRHDRPHAHPDRVHFVQGDLLAPPLAAASIDVIYSSGVLHHTPDPERTFATLCGLLRPGGTFYLWVYRRQHIVSAAVTAIRSATTRVPPGRFSVLADRAAPAVLLACRVLNAVGIPKYVRTRRESALALIDVFGTPYMHFQSPEQVRRWFTARGFDDVWLTNDNSPRGFGMCGRLSESASSLGGNQHPASGGG